MRKAFLVVAALMAADVIAQLYLASNVVLVRAFRLVRRGGLHEATRPPQAARAS